MIWFYIILLLVVPGLEFWLLMWLDWPLALLAFESALTALAGWWFSQGEDLSLWSELESDRRNNRVPTAEALNAMMMVLGGWALITPGLITDVLGALMLAPKAREKAVPFLRGWLRARWS
ncbi:MAG: FxsA family protein [Deltaproteobacteria bacterium]|nr:FxsA family protein [Deltaproteobacteria bacterium]